MKYVIPFLLLASVVLTVLSQDAPKAVKIEQFNDQVEPISALKEKLGILFERLGKEPSTTRGYVFVGAVKYKNLQIVSDVAHEMAERKASRRSRIIFAGYPCFYGKQFVMTEFWLLPQGSEEPYKIFSCDISCPLIAVSGKPIVTDRQEKLYFSASVSGDVSYRWKVVGGTVIRGQGTPVIIVKARANVNKVNATVKIGKLPPMGFCQDTDSFTTQIQSK